MLGLAVDSFNAKLIDNAVMRHILIPVADGSVRRKALVKHGNQGDLTVRRAVGLRYKVCKDDRPEVPRCFGEKLACRWLVNALFDDLTCGIVPEGTLRKSTESR